MVDNDARYEQVRELVMETQTEYGRIAGGAEKFFRSLRRVIVGLSVLTVALWVLALLFYAMGW